MILSPAIAEKAAVLAETDDSLLPLFAPLERATIIALKMMKNENEAADGNLQHSESLVQAEASQYVELCSRSS